MMISKTHVLNARFVHIHAVASVDATRRRVASARRVDATRRAKAATTNKHMACAEPHAIDQAMLYKHCLAGGLWVGQARSANKKTHAARISYSSQHTQHKQTEISVLTIKAQLCYRAFPLIRFCPLTCPKQSFCFILIFEGPGDGSSGSS